MRHRLYLSLIATLVIAISVSFNALAQEDSASGSTDTAAVGYPVVVQKDTIFRFYDSRGFFGPENRRDVVQQVMEGLLDRSEFFADSLTARTSPDGLGFFYRDTLIFNLTNIDIAQNGIGGRQATRDTILTDLRTVLGATPSSLGFTDILVEIGLIALTLIVVILLIRLINRAFRGIRKRVMKESDVIIRRLRLQELRVISAESQVKFIQWMVNAVRVLVIIVVLYLALPIIFSIIPGMENVAQKLIGYILSPLRQGVHALVDYIPEMITIVIIVFFTRLLLRALRTISMDIAREKLHINGFYPDWAMPTYSLVRVLVMVFAFVLMFPLLPGSGSKVFQGVSVFLGLLISLGSQSAISNMIAGLVITYMRAFAVGDRVKIGDTVGDVLERSMLVTRVRTIKNEVVTIPNSEIMTNHTVNYTSDQKKGGLILYSSITIGYDVPWRKVHDMLIRAALNTDGLKSEPQPFVLQTSLDDFYISYQINAYTDRETQAARIYSELHANIQDVFAKEDVEIMSPHYRVNRGTDMDDSTIPPPVNPGAPGE